MIVTGAVGVAALAFRGTARAQTKKPDARATLLGALADCSRTGEVCVAHCATELAQGNKELANCNLRVHEMLALVGAMQRLAALDTPLARKQAELCAAACRTCKDACYDHKAHFAHGMHLACKECGESCERCEAACRAYAAT